MRHLARVGVLVGQVFVRRPIRRRQPARARRVVHLLNRVQLCPLDRPPRRLHANDHAALHRVYACHVLSVMYSPRLDGKSVRSFGTRGAVVLVLPSSLCTNVCDPVARRGPHPVRIHHALDVGVCAGSTRRAAGALPVPREREGGRLVLVREVPLDGEPLVRCRPSRRGTARSGRRAEVVGASGDEGRGVREVPGRHRAVEPVVRRIASSPTGHCDATTAPRASVVDAPPNASSSDGEEEREGSARASGARAPCSTTGVRPARAWAVVSVTRVPRRDVMRGGVQRGWRLEGCVVA